MDEGARVPQGIGYREGVAIAVFAAVLWSLMGLCIRLIGEASPWQVLFWRSLGAAAVLLPVLAWRTGGRPLAAIRAGGWLSVLGGAGIVVAFAGAIIAIQSTTIANAVFIFSVTPFMTATLGWLILGEAVSRRTWIAMGVGAVGVAIMVGEGLSLGAGFGNLMAFLSSAGFAIYTIVLRQGRGGEMIPAVLTGCLLAAAVSLAAILLRGEAVAIHAEGIAIAFAAGAVILGIGLTLFTLASRVVPASQLGLMSLVEVMLAPVWVWLFLGETATATTLIGGAILLSAVIWNLSAPPAPVQPAPQPAPQPSPQPAAPPYRSP